MNIGPSTDYIQNFLVSFEVTEMLWILKQIVQQTQVLRNLNIKKLKIIKQKYQKVILKKKYILQDDKSQKSWKIPVL